MRQAHGERRRAFLVDRVLPDVPVRQYVLTLPYELRKLVAFKADVLTAIARIFVEASSRATARAPSATAIETPQCGSVNFVQRFGSSEPPRPFHLVALDGVFARDAQGELLFHPAAAPTAADLDAIVARTARRVDRLAAQARLPRRLATRSALERAAGADGARRLRCHRDGARQRGDACHATARRTTTGTARREERPDKPALAVERDGFNVHAGVRIEAGDDLGSRATC